MPNAEGKKFMWHCFVCEKTLSSSLTGKLRHEFAEPSQDATCWVTEGNYGSALFDSHGSEQLHLRICDSCLEKGRKYVYRVGVEKQVKAIKAVSVVKF